MAVIEYDEYKQKLQALEPTLGELSFRLLKGHILHAKRPPFRRRWVSPRPVRSWPSCRRRRSRKASGTIWSAANR